MSACPLCKSERSVDFPIYYTFNQKEFQAKQCAACSFIFLSPRLTPDELKLLYSNEYFLHDGADFGAHSPTDYETAAIKGSVKFPEILGWIKKFKPSGDFFEVGCGMGYFLEYARKAGYSVSGIEYAELGAHACKEKFGLNVWQSSFEDYPAQENRYDVMFMGDVLEHLIDPLAMMEKAHAMIRETGVVAVEVPSMFNSIVGRAAALGFRLIGKQKKMPMPPYHVNEFTPATLEAMIKKAGFKKAIIIQRIKTPESITLRGNFFEKAAKKSLQYPNYAITKLFGTLGDRLLGIGIK